MSNFFFFSSSFSLITCHAALLSANFFWSLSFFSYWIAVWSSETSWISSFLRFWISTILLCFASSSITSYYAFANSTLFLASILCRFSLSSSSLALFSNWWSIFLLYCSLIFLACSYSFNWLANVSLTSFLLFSFSSFFLYISILCIWS